MKNLTVAFLVMFTSYSCTQQNPNLTDTGKDELASLEVEDPLDSDSTSYQDLIYVPIYSDIYIDVNNQKNLLAATLSIRNTSLSDSLFISKIDYYNTDGELVRKYIKNQISIPPMATVNYVIRREDDTGGTGANFIVKLSSKSSTVKPLIQAVMVGHYSNKGFSFSTDGYSIK